jgi:hypothetical protein
MSNIGVTCNDTDFIWMLLLSRLQVEAWNRVIVAGAGSSSMHTVLPCCRQTRTLDMRH